MNEFKDQLDAAEKDKVNKHVTELREIAAKGQAGDGAVTADAIREKINETQQASLSLFQKVRNHSLVTAYHPHTVVMYRSMRRRTRRAHLPLQRRRRKRRRKRRRIKSSSVPIVPSPCCLSLQCPSCYIMTSRSLPYLDTKSTSSPSPLACLLYLTHIRLSPLTPPHSVEPFIHALPSLLLCLYPTGPGLVVGIYESSKELLRDLSKKLVSAVSILYVSFGGSRWHGRDWSPLS